MKHGIMVDIPTHILEVCILLTEEPWNPHGVGAYDKKLNWDYGGVEAVTYPRSCKRFLSGGPRENYKGDYHGFT